MINWQGTVISQYNQSKTIQSLLYAINQWIDPTKDIDAFYKYIWNVDTAQGYGLDVWGRIVAVGRVLKVQVNDPYWGFDEATTVSAWPFNTTTVDLTGPQKGGIFYQNEPLTGNYILSDDGYRTLILAKALFNITSGSIPAMNQILLSLFASVGRAYIVDNLDMSMTYKFEFVPTPVISAIVSQSGVLPRPTGVSVTYSFGPSTALPMHVGAIIGGVGLIRANPTVFFKPSRLSGVGSLRASAIGVHTTNALIGGRGGVAATSGAYQAQKVAAAARIAGTGSARGAAPTQGAGRVAGVGGMRADASVMRHVQAAATVAGRGAVGVNTSVRFSVPIRGAGSVRANGTVR